MHHPRSYHTLTSLPDGTVLATGGTSRSDGVDMSTAVLPAEIWNPETETWTEMAAQATAAATTRPRCCCRTAACSRPAAGSCPATRSSTSATRRSSRRRTCSRARARRSRRRPRRVQHGSTLHGRRRRPRSSIAKVSLVRLGSVTHTFDQNQRFIPLNFTNTGGVASACRRPRTRTSRLPATTCSSSSTATACRRWPSSSRMPAPNEDATAPTAPTNLSATGGLGKVDLTWTASTRQRRRSAATTSTAPRRPGFTPTAANRVGQPTGTSFTDSGLAGGHLLLPGPGRGPGGQPEHAVGRGDRDRDRRHHRPDRLGHRARRRRHASRRRSP